MYTCIEALPTVAYNTQTIQDTVNITFAIKVITDQGQKDNIDIFFDWPVMYQLIPSHTCPEIDRQDSLSGKDW